ncbi:MAG: IS66 family transposase [Pseudobdellovibrionaceae bacterium]
MSKQELFFSSEESLEVRLQGALHLLKQEQEKNKNYEDEVSRLHEIIAGLKRAQFGKKSERWESSEQLCFNEAEFYIKNAKPEDGEETEIEVRGHTKKRGHRKALPEDLEREVIVLEVPPSERFSKEGLPLKIIGYEVSEKLSYEPSKTKVIEYRRAKYGVDGGDYEKTAPPVPSVIPKGIATPELVSSIVTKKYAYGMPLYRQEEMFAELGIAIPRQTMARWVIKHAEACQPVYNVLQDRLLESFYVSCDETQTQVLKEKGRTAESTSWMWVRSTPFGKNKIILFDYDPHRSAEVAARIFADFKGFLQVDGFASYNVLEEKDGVIRIGCNMHGRRYFEQAKTEGAKNGQTLAEVGLAYYKKLYDLEEDFKDLAPDARNQARLEKQKPIWDEFKSWVDSNHQKVPPKSKIGKAFAYFLSEYEYLIGYLKDGRLNMDNGFAERAIRKFAIGRNNWMFADSESGANASAMFYSLLCTMKINDVNLYAAMTLLFREIPKSKTIEDFEILADIIVGARPIP